MGTFPNPETQFKPGESGNPDGLPKGTKHLATWIQQLLNDEKFEQVIFNLDRRKISYKGAPVKAIIGVAIHKAMKGDVKWAEWLAKHGYGTKTLVEFENPIAEILSKYGLGDVRETTETESRSSQDSA